MSTDFLEFNYNNIKQLPNSAKDINPNRINKNLTVPVIQLDFDDNYIREYSSMSEAARAINRKREGIRDCCRGKQVSAYGFKWRYKYE